NATQLAGAAVAVAEVPRRMAHVRRGNAQAQRAAVRVRERNDAVLADVVGVAGTAHPAVAANPFSPRHALPASRPWPRSLVPGLSAGGAFNVDYGGLAPQSPSFYPFEPQRLQPRPAPQAGDTP
ncbi:MAG: hypothetical protein HOQ02_09890, partial [Lysobacter sp.]|nr:hypothetical protein [Lysobacter sp.]